jgi:hypothetical protein
MKKSAVCACLVLALCLPALFAQTSLGNRRKGVVYWGYGARDRYYLC